MNLKGKTALITGASKGIGRSIASLLAQEGVHVGLISRTLEDLQAMWPRTLYKVRWQK